MTTNKYSMFTESRMFLLAIIHGTKASGFGAKAFLLRFRLIITNDKSKTNALKKAPLVPHCIDGS